MSPVWKNISESQIWPLYAIAWRVTHLEQGGQLCICSGSKDFDGGDEIIISDSAVYKRTALAMIRMQRFLNVSRLTSHRSGVLLRLAKPEPLFPADNSVFAGRQSD